MVSLNIQIPKIRNYNNDVYAAKQIFSKLYPNTSFFDENILDKEGQKSGDWSICLLHDGYIRKIQIGKKSEKKYTTLSLKQAIKTKHDYNKHCQNLMRVGIKLPEYHSLQIIMLGPSKYCTMETQTYIKSTLLTDSLINGIASKRIIDEVTYSIVNFSCNSRIPTGIDVNSSNFLSDGTYIDLMPPLNLHSADNIKRKLNPNEHNKRFLRFLYTKRGILQFLICSWTTKNPKYSGIILDSIRSYLQPRQISFLTKHVNSPIFFEDMHSFIKLSKAKRNTILSKNYISKLINKIRFEWL